MVTLLASAVTPLLGVLGALVGMGGGFLLVQFVRRPPPQRQRERELAIARDTARRTFNETLAVLFDRQDQ